MRSLAKRAVPILLCLLAAPAFAASPRWTLLGPDGHDARILAVAPSNPKVVYANAFAEEGLFRSLDGGVTWSWPERETLVPGDLSTQVIAVDRGDQRSRRRSGRHALHRHHDRRLPDGRRRGGGAPSERMKDS